VTFRLTGRIESAIREASESGGFALVKVLHYRERLLRDGELSLIEEMPNILERETKQMQCGFAALPVTAFRAH
jgi:hypothetical protein